MPPSNQALLMEDEEAAAIALKEQLEKHDVRTEICFDEDSLIESAALLEDKALVAVDLDMGQGRRREGISAIRRLDQLRKTSKKDICVAALTSHGDLKSEAAAAGADAFISKESAATDALELLLVSSANSIAVESRKAQDIQAKLAEREYRNLGNQLRRIRDSTHDSERWISSALATVRRALSWPVLLPNEQLILAMLDEQLDHAQREGEMDRESVLFCISGSDILESNRGSSSAVTSWLSAASMKSSIVTFNWLDDDWEDS